MTISLLIGIIVKSFLRNGINVLQFVSNVKWSGEKNAHIDTNKKMFRLI